MVQWAARKEAKCRQTLERWTWKQRPHRFTTTAKLAGSFLKTLGPPAPV